MKGIKITPIYEEPFLCPSKFAMVGLIASIIMSISVGIAQKNGVIGIGLTIILLITLGITYIVYRVDKSIRRHDECFVSIGQMAEYADIKQFHEQYKVVNDLGNNKYLAVKRSYDSYSHKEVLSWTE